MSILSSTANLLAAAVVLAAPLRAQDAPDAHAILRTVRLAQAAQARTLSGDIRKGGQTLPFLLVWAGNNIRYEFSDPPQIIQLHLGEKDVRLEEIAGGKTEKVSPRRFDERVRNTDISYEDLSMCFLYWPVATVKGEQSVLLQKCWIVEVQPGPHGDTQYSKVDLWISKRTGALMEAEAFDAAGKLFRRFKVISGQPIGEGQWILKEMRIETLGGHSPDRTPTYLDIEKPAS